MFIERKDINRFSWGLDEGVGEDILLWGNKKGIYYLNF
jgi:hypothetical protein